MTIKKFFVFITIVVIITNIAGCSTISRNEKFKRINISGETLYDGTTNLENIVSSSTKVEYQAKETFSDTMPIYHIVPRQISDDEFIEFADFFDVSGNIEKDGEKTSITLDNGVRVYMPKSNRISYDANIDRSNPITQSDEELINTAKSIVSNLPLLEDEYECLGVVSTQTLHHSQKGEMVVSKRIAFCKLLDDKRVIGDEICNLYFCSEGLYAVNIELYDYNSTGEMDMLSLEDAKASIKTPDSFSIIERQGVSQLTTEADTLCVERVKLLYVNQYSSGSTIIQPVYNFIGVASHGDEEMEFQSKVIAIPKKYTYDD